MRIARRKVTDEDAVYHVAPRFAGPVAWHPMTDADKQAGLALVAELSRLFVVEPICACWMGNHYHLILAVPGAVPDASVAAARWNAFYGDRREHLDPRVTSGRCGEVAERLVDFTQFMRLLNQRFTHYYNCAHQRTGPLWAGRFKSTILDDREALWNCAKYVELNPVRVGLVEDPAAYRFSSWGWLHAHGQPLFDGSYYAYLRRSRGEGAADWSDEAVREAFGRDLARAVAVERDETAETPAPGGKVKNDSMPLRFLRRTRHWTDGGIIGSKAFVREMGRRFEDPERVMRRALSRGRTADGAFLYCLKRLT